MRKITDTMYYDNYKFDVELDTGSGLGANQLTVWVAEKVNIDTVPLKQFGVAQLLNALIEPERTRLHAKLEEEKLACQQSFELEIANLLRPYAVPREKQEQKTPEKVKRKARKLREQKQAALQRLEVEFARRELWSLDRRWFDCDTLLAQSRVYSEEFSLRDFYFGEAFLHERLEALVEQARSIRQPISGSALAGLCIEPIDLLDIHWSRNRPSPGWDELDEGEVVQLDPEGLSLIAFEYESITAHYVFHLPFRVAEQFLPEQLVRELRTRPRDSREYGVFFGRTITEAESQEHPVAEILHELGVDSAAVCPHELKDKREHVSQLVSRYSYWDDDGEDDDEDEDWGDEEWEVLPPRPRKHKHAGERAPGTCPLCGRVVEPGSALRVEHWRHNHPDQDLMVSSAAWVLGKSKTELKSPSTAIPPDYWGPSSEQGENGARFWKLESLETAIRQGQECLSQS